MVLRPEELELAQEYCRATRMEALTAEQMSSILARGRVLHRWYKEHLAFHYVLNLLVLSMLIYSDYAILLRLPAWLLGGAPYATGRLVFAAVVCGFLHGWLLYSLGIFTMHEGAAHQMIFPGTNRVSRVLNYVAGNLARIGGAEPVYYAQGHMSHHALFGSERDGEFLNFVLPRRFWLSLLPFAAILPYTDFVAHRPPFYNRSRVLSAVIGFGYHIAYAALMASRFGGLFTILTLVLFFPHLGYFLDRMRQYTEHNMMPLENKDGSRSFGLGFWGMLIGGGPWGSPCHWEHHLAASLPWYQQLALHQHVKRILTPEQKRQFMVEPVVGFPKLLIRLLKEPNQFVQSSKRREMRAG